MVLNGNILRYTLPKISFSSNKPKILESRDWPLTRLSPITKIFPLGTMNSKLYSSAPALLLNVLNSVSLISPFEAIAFF